MKLKYYLRGLGIGVAVSSLLMGYAGNTNAVKAADEVQVAETEEDATDVQSLTLRERQKNMQDTTEEESESIIIEETEKAVENDVEDEKEVETSEDTAESVADAANAFVKKKVSEEADTKESTVEETEESKEEQVETVTITVNQGEGSDTVSRKLENAGLIDSASEFDAYLMQHGYDKKITKGNHSVVPGATWMDIAKQLTK